MPTRMNQNTTLRYRNRIRDSANAAMLRGQHGAQPRSAVEVMKLDAYQLQMSPCSAAASVNDASVGLSMHQVVLVVSVLGLSAVSMRPGDRHQPEERERDEHADADPVEQLACGCRRWRGGDRQLAALCAVE